MPRRRRATTTRSATWRRRSHSSARRWSRTSARERESRERTQLESQRADRIVGAHENLRSARDRDDGQPRSFRRRHGRMRRRGRGTLRQGYLPRPVVSGSPPRMRRQFFRSAKMAADDLSSTASQSSERLHDAQVVAHEALEEVRSSGDKVASLVGAAEAIGGGRRPHRGHRASNQSARAQRHDRGGAGGRGRTRIRRRRGRSEEPCDAHGGCHDPSSTPM